MQARLQGFDKSYEEAAMDLGANEWTTFRRVTFPMILPGIVIATSFGKGTDPGGAYQINYVIPGGPQRTTQWILPCILAVESMSSDAMQQQLDLYLADNGTHSLVAALEADRTLGGVAQTARILRVEVYAGFFAELMVEVLTRH